MCVHVSFILRQFYRDRLQRKLARHRSRQNEPENEKEPEVWNRLLELAEQFKQSRE